MQDNLSLDEKPIPWRDKVTYLGLSLDKRLNFNHQLQLAREKARPTVGRLIALLGNHSMLSMKNKLKIYTVVIRPQIAYASPAWIYALPRTKIVSLNVIQNKILRLVTSAPWYVRNEAIRSDLNILPLTNFINNLSASYFLNVNSHPNPEISNLL